MARRKLSARRLEPDDLGPQDGRMDPENVLAVLGIIGTLVGSLGGVALAQRHERKVLSAEFGSAGTWSDSS